jgi:hypothetical protein
MLGYAEYAYIFIYIYIYLYICFYWDNSVSLFPNTLYTRDPTQPCTSRSLLSFPSLQAAATPNQARTCQASVGGTASPRTATATQAKPKSPNEAKPYQTKTCSSSNSSTSSLLLLLPISIITTHILESSRKRSFTPSFVFLSLLCPHLINHIPSTVIWIAYIKTNSIALDVHVPSWSINRINHPRVVSLVQPAADFTLPIVEVLQSSRLL